MVKQYLLQTSLLVILLVLMGCGGDDKGTLISQGQKVTGTITMEDDYDDWNGGVYLDMYKVDLLRGQDYTFHFWCPGSGVLKLESDDDYGDSWDMTSYKGQEETKEFKPRDEGLHNFYVYVRYVNISPGESVEYSIEFE